MNEECICSRALKLMRITFFFLEEMRIMLNLGKENMTNEEKVFQ